MLIGPNQEAKGMFAAEKFASDWKACLGKTVKEA
jgi:hypothetical protein